MFPSLLTQLSNRPDNRSGCKLVGLQSACGPVSSLNEVITVVFLRDLIQMIEETIKERDQLMTTVEDLREKSKKATETQQEVETEREDAAQKISKVP